MRGDDKRRGLSWWMKRNGVTRRTEGREGLEIAGEIEAGIERGSVDTDLIQRRELLTLPLQLPTPLSDFEWTHWTHTHTQL